MGDTLDLENSMYSQYLINRTVGSKKSAQIYCGTYIMKSPDWIFSTPENERKKTKIFKNILEFFCFPIVLGGLGYFRFRKLDVFAIFNQSDCGFKKKCSDIFWKIYYEITRLDFFLLQEMKEKKQKSLKIFLNFL